jgi:hypothetical protein
MFTSSDSHRIEPIEGTLVRILENGNLLELDYDGAMTKHAGSLWWGTAVGYRAMQAAALALSEKELWSRDNLYVVSAHPGSGVADAINYVTGVVDHGRYNCVRDESKGMGCHSGMKYDWWVSDGQKTAAIRLRPDMVPWTFYTLSDRLGKPTTSDEDKRAFELFKVNLSAKIWNAPLASSFQVDVSPEPLAVGQVPAPIQASDYWDSVRVIHGAALGGLP